jgi:alpha-1,2-mannosyltransferase
LGHPPTTSFWRIPLAPLEKAIAAEVIDLANLFLLALSIYLCARELKVPAPAAVCALVWAWFLTTDGMTNHWHAVQISAEIAFYLVLGWVYLRRGADIPAGVAVGVAATFKLFPGVIILFLLIARRYRAFLAASATYLGVGAVMTARYGLRSWQQFLFQQGEQGGFWVGHVRNASLQGIVLRVISPLCVSTPMANTRTSVISGVASALLLVVAAVISRRMLKDARERNPHSIDLPFALFTVLATFLNPWIWEHYQVLLIQPVFVLVVSVWTSFRQTWRAWLDEQAPNSALARHGVALLFVVSGVCASAYMVATNQYAKTEIESLWRAHPSPWYHRYLHLMEAFNWLPWVIILLLCMLATWHLSARARVLAPVGDTS